MTFPNTRKCQGGTGARIIHTKINGRHNNSRNRTLHKRPILTIFLIKRFCYSIRNFSRHSPFSRTKKKRTHKSQRRKRLTKSRFVCCFISLFIQLVKSAGKALETWSSHFW